MDLWCRCFSAKMYAETKELGSVGGPGTRSPPPDPPMNMILLCNPQKPSFMVTVLDGPFCVKQFTKKSFIAIDYICKSPGLRLFSVNKNKRPYKTGFTVQHIMKLTWCCMIYLSSLYIFNCSIIAVCIDSFVRIWLENDETWIFLLFLRD